MEKGGGGNGDNDNYTKSVSQKGGGKQYDQNNSSSNCDNINVETVITRPILEQLSGIEEGSVLPLNFPPRIEKIEILNFNGIVCGYVTSSVSKLCKCYDEGRRFEAVLMRRNNDTSFSITVRNKR